MKFRRSCPCCDAKMASLRRRWAFTLVELLVVIGIIALLISILLPALGAARKQAAKVKCESALHDIYNAFLMYVGDNNGWAPPAKCSGGPYTISSAPGVTFNVSTDAYGNTIIGPYWFDFLAKYETKAVTGNAAITASQAADAERSIFWGCPAWQGYAATGTGGSTGTIKQAGGLALTQTGYGMNGCPEYTASWPGATGARGGGGNVSLGETSGYTNDIDTPVFGTSWAPPASGKWYKFTTWNHAAERCLLGDSLFWFLMSRPPMTPPNFAAEPIPLNNVTWAPESDSANATQFDYYRHGTYPKPQNGDELSVYGGKVAFNVLFSDGHVVTETDRAKAYQDIRMKYPG